MEKKDIEFRKTTTDCKKIAEQKAATCRYPGCNEKAINSHILQKNGILSKIAPDRHLWQLEIDNFSETKFRFARRGLNETLSFSCFCNSHDTKLFEKIEGGSIDFNDYKSCLLFSLRTLYNEMFRKEVNVAHFTCLIDKLPKKFDNADFRGLVEADKLGIEDLKITEKKIWDDLSNNTESFVFQYRELSPIDLCISSFYTYDTSIEIANFPPGERPSEIVINFFPYKGKSMLLMGYSKEDENKVKGDVNTFFKESEKRVQRQLTNLFLFRCETWVCSDKLYKSVIAGYENFFYNAIKFAVENFHERKNFDLNIFEPNFLLKFAIWTEANKELSV